MIIQKPGTGNRMRYYQYIAGEHITGDRICGEIKCRKIVIDQWTYESQIICPYIGNAW